MNEPINLKTSTLTVSPAIAGRVFLLVTLALAWFTLSPTGRAVTPAPDGDYANNNTAEGHGALQDLTIGTDNTANGFEALFNNTTGYFNTANGSEALASNTEGGANTANGAFALSSNTTGGDNAATGFDALQKNTTGNGNTADGTFALSSNTTGGDNTAIGDIALTSNTTGLWNTATGFGALGSNTNGRLNTATGYLALDNNVTGGGNTAIGDSALAGNITGSNNIALGSNAGINLTTGNNNIDIGARGVADESNTIRIGTVGVQTSAYIRGISGVTVASGATVIVDAHGHLGTVQSLARFKDEIKPMDKASEAILTLKPVTFRYKKELDRDGIPQFGLVAEEVEKVNPDLVARDENGQVYTVRYEAVNTMLLNEFLKEHRKVQDQEVRLTKQEATISQLKSTVAQQHKGMEILTATLKEQAAQIRKVSSQLELSKPSPQMVANTQ